MNSLRFEDLPRNVLNFLSLLNLHNSLNISNKGRVSGGRTLSISNVLYKLAVIMAAKVY